MKSARAYRCHADATRLYHAVGQRIGEVGYRPRDPNRDPPLTNVPTQGTTMTARNWTNLTLLGTSDGQPTPDRRFSPILRRSPDTGGGSSSCPSMASAEHSPLPHRRLAFPSRGHLRSELAPFPAPATLTSHQFAQEETS